jgi:hypothetical protein
MKPIPVVLLLAMTLSSVAYGQKKAAGAKPQAASTKAAAPAGRVQEQLKKLEEEWATAYIKGDATALSRILADDYSMIDENCSVSDKAKCIKDLTSVGLDF